MLPPTVFIVDDDRDQGRSLARLAGTIQLPAEAFLSACHFLDSVPPDRSGCLVLDLRLPDMSGLELQRELTERQYRLPIILVTAYAEVHVAVEAMKAGAYDFVEKPYRPQEMLEKIQHAMQADRAQRSREEQIRQIGLHLDSLSPRERQVLELLVDGRTTKQISHQLQIGITTVDYHRHNVLRKMHVENVVQLTRLCDLYLLDGASRARAAHIVS